MIKIMKAVCYFMRKIMLINTGGTFSCKSGEHGLAPQIHESEIRAKIDCSEAELDIEQYSSLDSANIGPEDWKSLAIRISEIEKSYDGVVIIHGTDTMAYTASMLSFMLQNISIPVVITGSQMPLGVKFSDASDNCNLAVKVASSDICGVYVAFDRKVMLGCRVSKVRTVSFNAFESINYPLAGEVNAFGLSLNMNVCRKKTMTRLQLQSGYSDKIAVLKLFPGMRQDIFKFLHDNGYEGVYIEGFGLGGVPFEKYDITADIKKASESGMTILVGSQCRYEGSNLNVYETGQRILESGGIPVYDMTQEAVVTKLMWSLGQAKNREQIAWMFSKNLVGEVTI